MWIVFDRDEHDRVPETLTEADAAGIGVAYSNACFELWPLLHLEAISRPTHRHDLQRRLRELHPGYDHDRGAEIDWSKLPPYADGALDRAITLHGRDPSGPHPDPSTSAWLFHHRCALADRPEPLLAGVPEPLRPALKRRVARPLRDKLP